MTSLVFLAIFTIQALDILENTIANKHVFGASQLVQYGTFLVGIGT